MELKVHTKKKLDEKSATSNGTKSAKQECKCSVCCEFGCEKIPHEAWNVQGKGMLEWKCECVKEKFQGMNVSTKRASHKMIHSLLNSTPAVARDELCENKQMKRSWKYQQKQKLLHVRSCRHNNENRMLEDSHAGLRECVRLRDGVDSSNVQEEKDEHAAKKIIINLERVYVVVTAKRMLELMHGDSQVAREAA